MKQLIATLMCSLGMIAPLHAENTDISSLENVIYINPVTASAGTEYTLSVRMKNTVVAEGFQFDLVLPDGITVATDEDGFARASLSEERTNAKKTNHFDAEFKMDGSLNIQAYSSNGNTISGNDGEVALIVINIASDMAAGSYPILLKNIAISDVNSQSKRTALVETSITIEGVADTRKVLDETSTVMPEATTDVDVRLNRTIKADCWSTIVLPFTATGEQVKAAFGSDVKLAAFTAWSSEEDDEGAIVGIDVTFTTADAEDGIAANTPMLIRVSEDVTTATFDGVTLEPEEEPVVQVGKRASERGWFHGTYVKTTVPKENLFLNGNKFWYSTGATVTKGYRGYFEFRDVLDAYYDATEVKVNLLIDGTETKVEGMHVRDAVGTIYDLSGRKVSKPGQRGVYIIDGKKMVIK